MQSNWCCHQLIPWPTLYRPSPAVATKNPEPKTLLPHPCPCLTLPSLLCIPPQPDGSNCCDNNVCTQTDKCSSGTCVGTNPITCTADQCHVAGTCQPLSGCPPPTNKVRGQSCRMGVELTPGCSMTCM